MFCWGLFWSSNVEVLVVVQGLWLFVVLLIVSVWIVVVEEVGGVYSIRLYAKGCRYP